MKQSVSLISIDKTKVEILQTSMITFIHMEKNIALKKFHESAAQRRHQNKTMQRSPILLSHITFQIQNTDETYEQFIEQQHIIKFRSQNSLLFIPRCSDRLDPSIAYFAILPNFIDATLSYINLRPHLLPPL